MRLISAIECIKEILKRIIVFFLILTMLFGLLGLPSKALEETGSYGPTRIPAWSAGPSKALEETGSYGNPQPPAVPTEGDAWDGTSTVAPSVIETKGGTNYYVISSCAELAFIAQECGEWLQKNYLLGNNLILNDTILTCDADGVLQNQKANLNQWTPIGNRGNPFTGIFDGNGFSISGLFIFAPDQYDVGLFGYSTGSVRNLTIVNAYLLAYGSFGTIAGYAKSVKNCTVSAVLTTNSLERSNAVMSSGRIGGVASSANELTNCYFYGAVIGSTLMGGTMGGIAATGGNADHCINYGRISGCLEDIGGVIGNSYDFTVTNCKNFGIVSGNAKNIGGIVGKTDGGCTQNCVNYGTVICSSSRYEYVGGVAGYQKYKAEGCINYGEVISEGNYAGGIAGCGLVKNCDNYGNVTGKGTGCGGVVGLATGGAVGASGGYVSEYSAYGCSNFGAVMGGTSVGGITGQLVGTVKDCYNTSPVVGLDKVGGIAGTGGTATLQNCYNIGVVVCDGDSDMRGEIIGSDGALWGKDKAYQCYYLNTDNSLFGCGGVEAAELEPDGFNPSNSDALKRQETFETWSFTETTDRYGRPVDPVWAIDSINNTGYPYLYRNPVGEVLLSGLLPLPRGIELRIGERVEMNALPVPSHASIGTLSWTSNDPDIVTINENGIVTAHSVGTATIFISSGDIREECPISVYFDDSCPITQFLIEPETVSVSYGTSKYSVINILKRTVQVSANFESQGTKKVDVSNWTAEEYDQNKPGSYLFTASVDGVNNPYHIEDPSVVVTVDRYDASGAAFDLGTKFVSIGTPESVAMEALPGWFNPGNGASLGIGDDDSDVFERWNCDGVYDGDVTGTYHFTAKLRPAAGDEVYSGLRDLSASITVWNATAEEIRLHSDFGGTNLTQALYSIDGQMLEHYGESLDHITLTVLNTIGGTLFQDASTEKLAFPLKDQYSRTEFSALFFLPDCSGNSFTLNYTATGQHSFAVIHGTVQIASNPMLVLDRTLHEAEILHIQSSDLSRLLLSLETERERDYQLEFVTDVSVLKADVGSVVYKYGNVGERSISKTDVFYANPNSTQNGINNLTFVPADSTKAPAPCAIHMTAHITYILYEEGENQSEQSTAVEIMIRINQDNETEFDLLEIGKLLIHQADGRMLDSIPQDSFFVTIPVTFKRTVSDPLIILATYSENNQFLSAKLVSVMSMSAGSVIQLMVPVDNTDGMIAFIKAFAVSSATYSPIGKTSEYPVSVP